MEAKNNNFLRIALYFIFGVLGSIVAGLITFGPIMFSIGPGRQFIMVGIVGSIIFITVRFYKKWIAALIALIFPLALLISFKVFQIPLAESHACSGQRLKESLSENSCSLHLPWLRFIFLLLF
jgi:hypothetical protein